MAKGKLFKKLFKRKEGGTPLGNTIRGLLNKASGGLLGNGLLMKTGKGKEADQSRMMQGLGAAGQASKSYGARYDDPMGQRGAENASDVTKGAIIQWLQEKWYIAVGVVVGLPLAIWSVIRLSKPKNNRRGRR